MERVRLEICPAQVRSCRFGSGMSLGDRSVPPRKIAPEHIKLRGNPLTKNQKCEFLLLKTPFALTLNPRTQLPLRNINLALIGCLGMGAKKYQSIVPVLQISKNIRFSCLIVHTTYYPIFLRGCVIYWKDVRSVFSGVV